MHPAIARQIDIGYVPGDEHASHCVCVPVHSDAVVQSSTHCLASELEIDYLSQRSQTGCFSDVMHALLEAIGCRNHKRLESWDDQIAQHQAAVRQQRSD